MLDLTTIVDDVEKDIKTVITEGENLVVTVETKINAAATKAAPTVKAIATVLAQIKPIIEKEDPAIIAAVEKAIAEAFPVIASAATGLNLPAVTSLIGLVAPLI